MARLMPMEKTSPSLSSGLTISIRKGNVKTSPSISSEPTISIRKGKHQEFDGGEFVGVHDPEVLPLALLTLQIVLSI